MPVAARTFPCASPRELGAQLLINGDATDGEGVESDAERAASDGNANSGRSQRLAQDSGAQKEMPPQLDADRDAFSAKGRISKVSCAGTPDRGLALDFGSTRLAASECGYWEDRNRAE